jgi:hypothetical protein
MIYVTYLYDKEKRKACITLDMYNKLKEDSLVEELVIHPTEQTMNENFSGTKQKTYLRG